MGRPAPGPSARLTGIGGNASLHSAFLNFGGRDLPPTFLSALSGGVHITAVGSRR